MTLDRLCREVTTPARLALLAALGGMSWPAYAQSGTITLDQTRIYYETSGRGRAVVFIHGFGLNLREWDDQVKALSPDHRVVAYDRRGFGKSTGLADVWSEPADLRELLDTLGVRSAVLVGHSGGAGVAMRFVIAHGDRVEGLVLYPGQPPLGFPVTRGEPNQLAGLDEFARQHGMDSLLSFMLALPQFRNPPNRPDIDRRIREMWATYSGRDLFEGRPTSGPYPLPTFEQMKALSIPTLFIYGEWEAPGPRRMADSMARWMPNARRVVIPGGGHGVHFAEADRFNRALRDFLRSLPPPSRR